MYCRTSACRLVPCREATCLAFSTSLSSTERVRFMHTVYVRTCRVSRGNGVREDMCQHARDASAAEIPMKVRQDETCMRVAFAEKRRRPRNPQGFRGHMERNTGFEPATFALARRRSTS